jgi:hypothetical protein
MNSTPTCDNCGGPTINVQQGRSIGRQCPTCGWSLFSTYTSPILLDTSTYTVRLVDADPRNASLVRLVAGLAGCNYLSARAMLLSNSEPLLRANAERTLAAIKQLRELHVRYLVEPDFPHAL